MADENTNPQPRTAEVIEAELLSIRDPIDTGEDGDLQAPTPAELREISDVADATRKGWVPKADYRGDPAKWKDARTFIEAGERFSVNQRREIDTLKARLASFEGTQKAFNKFQEGVLAKKDAELAAAISELRIQRSAATREGDDEGAIALEDRIDLLKEERAATKAISAEPQPQANEGTQGRGPNMEDPVLQEWISDGNAWFQDDPKLRDYAVAIGDSLIKEGETVRGRRFLDKISEKMAEEFPRKFRKQDTQASPRSPVEAGGRGTSQSNTASGGRSELDLPAEDRALMRQYIKEGWTTKEKFLSSYFAR
jgi:hypothetical protein